MLLPPCVLESVLSCTLCGPTTPQTPTLELTPHVAAPGPEDWETGKIGGTDYASGTSFASPYVAGCMALWLQQKQQQAEASGRALDPASVNQEAVMRAIVSGATGIPDKLQGDSWRQPVPWMGSGEWLRRLLMFTIPEASEFDYHIASTALPSCRSPEGTIEAKLTVTDCDRL